MKGQRTHDSEGTGQRPSYKGRLSLVPSTISRPFRPFIVPSCPIGGNTNAAIL